MERLLAQYPDRVPVVLRTLPPMDPPYRSKFLLPKEFTVAQTLSVIRRHVVPQDETQALFVMVGNGIMPRSTETLSELYPMHKSAEGIMPLTVRQEATFGYCGA